MASRFGYRPAVTILPRNRRRIKTRRRRLRRCRRSRSSSRRHCMVDSHHPSPGLAVTGSVSDPASNQVILPVQALDPVIFESSDLLVAAHAVFESRTAALRAEHAERVSGYTFRLRAKQAELREQRYVKGEELKRLQRKREQGRARLAWKRSQPTPLAKMSDREIENMIDDDVAEVAMGNGLDIQEGERLFEHQDRLEALKKAVDAKAWVAYERRLHGKLQYLDGFPASLVAVHPHYLPPKRKWAEDRRPCLQCQARKLVCTRTIGSVYLQDLGPECSRCLRHGDACLVIRSKAAAKGLDGAQHYRFADKERKDTLDAKELSSELEALAAKWLTMRDAIGVLKPLPLWHENDRDRARKEADPDYRPAQWWSVLKDGRTRW